MGTKVMVRATRSFNGRVENEWYYVDPDDAHIRALISGGYFEHQEALPIEVPETLTQPIDALPPDPVFAAKVKRKVRHGAVEAQPGDHHPDGAS